MSKEKILNSANNSFILKYVVRGEREEVEREEEEEEDKDPLGSEWHTVQKNRANCLIFKHLSLYDK